MNGSDLGRAVAGQIFFLLVTAIFFGGVLALGGYFAIGWLISHVSISIS